MADSNESYGSKLLHFWAPDGWASVGWLLLGLLPLFFFETFVHEGLHFLTALAAGTDPTLIPFPHFNTAFGSNLNGATMNTGGFSATPQIVCLFLLAGLIAVFIVTSPPWRWLRMLLVWWYLGIVLDLLYNTGRGLVGSFRPGTDWAKMAAETSSGLAIFISWLILILVLSQLVWIAFSRWHDNRPPAADFFEFRGFAIFLGILSLIAVILSFAIDDPAVVRNWWFWLFFVAQLASLIWYVAYIIWASVKK